MSQVKKLIAAGLLVAAAGSVTNGAVSWNDSLTMNDANPVRVSFPGWAPGPRGADDGVVQVSFAVQNFVGIDFASMNIKILPDMETSYGPGEFEAIVFDQTVTPTAKNGGADVGGYVFNDDKNLFWEFAAGEYEGGEQVVFTFTVLTPNMQLFDMEFEPNIVPAPGSLALLGVAGLAGVRRRR